MTLWANYTIALPLFLNAGDSKLTATAAYLVATGGAVRYRGRLSAGGPVGRGHAVSRELNTEEVVPSVQTSSVCPVGGYAASLLPARLAWLGYTY